VCGGRARNGLPLFFSDSRAREKSERSVPAWLFTAAGFIRRNNELSECRRRPSRARAICHTAGIRRGLGRSSSSFQQNVVGLAVSAEEVSRLLLLDRREVAGVDDDRRRVEECSQHPDPGKGCFVVAVGFNNKKYQSHGINR